MNRIAQRRTVCLFDGRDALMAGSPSHDSDPLCPAQGQKERKRGEVIGAGGIAKAMLGEDVTGLAVPGGE